MNPLTRGLEIIVVDIIVTVGSIGLSRKKMRLYSHYVGVEMKRWQLISRNPRGLFDILKDPNAETWLSTVELPMIGRELGIDIPEKYETCYFDENKESEILEVYNTQEDAIAGHERYRVQYGLV